MEKFHVIKITESVKIARSETDNMVVDRGLRHQKKFGAALFSNTEQESKDVLLTSPGAEQLRAIVDASVDMVWQLDLAGCWTFLNPAAENFYGRSPESLLGSSFEDFCEPDHFRDDMGMLQALFDGGTVTDYETVHRRADGYLVHISYSGAPIRDASGKIVGACGTARDVAERVTARCKLEKELGAARVG